MPTIGNLIVFATCQTIFKATGLIAGPERPPIIFASFGLLVLISIAIPESVLIRETASAPASETAFAIIVMSVTLGDSFTIKGSFVFFLTALTTRKAKSGFVPNSSHPSFLLGHDIFIS